MPLDLFLAVKFLREGRLQTVLLVVGATIGITVVFFITALITAVERTMVSQTLDVLPHIVVRRSDETARPLPPAAADSVVFAQIHKPAQRLRSIEGWQNVVSDLEATPGVLAVSPTASGPAMASRGRGTRAVTLLGVDPAKFGQVIAMEPRIRSGALRVEGDEVLIGTELANDLGVQAGDRIHITSISESRESFVISGIFDMGNADVNRRWVVVSLRSGQTLLDMPGGVSAVDVRLADIWGADAIADAVHARTGMTAESWMRTNVQLMVAIQSQRGATLMIRIFIMLAVAMGIASVLVVSVVQKSKQVGILRAMGVPRAMIVRVFLLQGTAIGVLGAVLGCGLGTLLSLWSETSNRTPDGTPMYPMVLPVSLYVTSAMIATGTGLIAAALPARRAARLEPSVAIRNE
jgi:lipoprotein-releasing system permease protein